MKETKFKTKEERILDVLEDAIDIAFEKKFKAIENNDEEGMVYWHGAYTILHYVLTEIEKIDVVDGKLDAISKEDD